MSWKKWKLGLLIGCLTGVFSGGVVAFIAPTVEVKSIVFIILYNICQNALLYMKDHPVDKITFDDTKTFIKENVSKEDAKQIISDIKVAAKDKIEGHNEY